MSSRHIHRSNAQSQKPANRSSVLHTAKRKIEERTRRKGSGIISRRRKRNEDKKSYRVNAFAHLEKTLTTPSPPPLTTQRPSRLQVAAHTPSPRISRWLVISCVQLRFSRSQNRKLASWPAETNSRPSGDRESDAMAAG